MKFLVLALVLLVAYMVWRAQRRVPPPEEGQAPPGQPSLPQDMVRCPVCSVHLPRPDAQAGRSGRLYCSHEHRRSSGD